MSAATLTAEALKVGGRYNWRSQPERLIYLGSRVYPCLRRWFQFALVEKPEEVWCEVLVGDLHLLEETKGAEGGAA